MNKEIDINNVDKLGVKLVRKKGAGKVYCSASNCDKNESFEIYVKLNALILVCDRCGKKYVI